MASCAFIVKLFKFISNILFAKGVLFQFVNTVANRVYFIDQEKPRSEEFKLQPNV